MTAYKLATTTAEDEATLPAFERVASQLREELINGALRSGQSLVEADLTVRFSASRNTIRESLRQLRCEGLVEYKRNCGVFVRELDASDIRDIYRIRRVLEIPAIANLKYLQNAHLADMNKAVHAAEQARLQDDWAFVGTCSLRFHQAIVALHSSPRLNDFFSSVAAQLRLLFVSGKEEKFFQSPWVSRDREIFEFLKTGKFKEASKALSQYLDDSETALYNFLKLHTDFSEEC